MKKFKDTEIKPCGHEGFETMPDGSCAVASCGKHTPRAREQWVQLLNKCDCFPTTLGHNSKCFLVRAVNAHEELLEALKVIEKNLAYVGIAGTVGAMRQVCREAIAKAERK